MGAHPKKISGAKNMQNLARFRTTLKFGGEYLRNGWRYLKSDQYFIYRDSSCVRRNKSGEVWSSDLGDFDVKSYLPKAHISEDHFSAHRGVLRPQIFTRAGEWPSFISALPTGNGIPLTSFFKGGSKIGLKCNKLTLRTSELGGLARGNFGTWRASMLGC